MLQSQHRILRLPALFMALLLALTGLLPAGAEMAVEGYVMTTFNGVSLRQTAQSTGEVLASLPNGTVLPVLDTEDGWYYVLYGSEFGFIAMDYARQISTEEAASVLPGAGDTIQIPEAEYAPEEEALAEQADAIYADETLYAVEEPVAEGEIAADVTAEESAPAEEILYAADETVWTDPEMVSDPAPVVDFEETPDPVTAYVSTPQGGTLTLREDKSTTARAVMYLPNGTEVYVLDTDVTWAQVLYEDVTGYVLSEYLVISDTEPQQEAQAEEAEEASEPAAEETIADEDEEQYFCVIVRTGGPQLELKAAPTDNGVVIARIQDESLLVVVGQEGYYYLTVYGGMNGYVSMDMVEIDTSLTAMAPYVFVMSQTVNVRTEPQRNANVCAHVNAQEVLPMWGSPYTNDGYTWYPVVAEGKEGYLRGDTCVMLSRHQIAQYTESGRLPDPSDHEASGYLMCMDQAVNVRAAAAVTARSLGKLELGDVLAWSDETTASGETWYKIDYHDQTAFVMGQYVKVLTNEEYAVWQQNNLLPEEQTVVVKETVAEAPAAVQVTEGGIAYTIKDKVLIRKEPSTMSVSVTRIGKSETPVTLLGETRQDENDSNLVWYLVEYGVYNGWIRGDMLYVNEQIAPAVSAEETVQAPAVQEIVIPEGDESDLIDMAFTNQDRVYLRRAPNVQSPSVAIVGSEHSYLTILSDAKLDESGAGYIWYEVQYNNITGYVRGDLIHLMTENMWEATFGSAYTQESPVLAPATQEEEYYVDDELEAEAVSAEPAAQAPVQGSMEVTAADTGAASTDIAYTLEENVFIRKQPSMQSASVTRITATNTYVQLMSSPVADSSGEPYTWYEVEYAMMSGYVRADLIHVVTNEEWEAMNPVDNAEDYTDTSLDGDGPIMPTESVEDGLGAYVTYETLRLGSTGDKVTELQQELFEQGYLSADDVTGEYNTATVQAVTTFQMDNNLTADGIAGQMTQSALFKTKSYDATLYPVEKSNWYNGSIQHVWTKGTVAVITDVYTGISFRARRLGGSYHADVEPLTASDTAAMCRIYGVSSAEEILSNKHWHRRPLWVTVGGRTYAASMYGVPHNYPDGDSIPDNDFSGQFCVHFVNSRVHRTGEVDAYHQQAIQYAYSHAPSKKK